MPYKKRTNWELWNKKRHEENKIAMQVIKDKPCVDCGGKFPHYVMEFDHVPEKGDKIASVANLTGSRKVTAKTVRDEIRKCDLVCANCHKIRTFFRVQNRAGRQGQGASSSLPS